MTFATPGTIHIFGGGAVGGTFAVLLARAGHSVVVIDSDAEHVNAINRQGLRIDGALTMTQPLSAATELAAEDRPFHAVVAVKAQATRAVLANLHGRLSEGAAMAFLQNGIGIYDALDMVEPGAIVGATTSMGAVLDRPGHIMLSGFGDLHAGMPGGVSATRGAAFLADALLGAHPSSSTVADVEGHIWGKLVLAAVYALSALRDRDFVDLLDERGFLVEASLLAGEVAATAAASGVTPKPVGGWDPRAFLSGDVVAQGSSWVSLSRAWNAHTQRRTGIWIDLAVKRRRTEVGALFESVRARAAATGVATPRLSDLLARFAGVEAGLGPPEAGAGREAVSPCGSLLRV